MTHKSLTPSISPFRPSAYKHLNIMSNLHRIAWDKVLIWIRLFDSFCLLQELTWRLTCWTEYLLIECIRTWSFTLFGYNEIKVYFKERSTSPAWIGGEGWHAHFDKALSAERRLGGVPPWSVILKWIHQCECKSTRLDTHRNARSRGRDHRGLII